MGIKSRELIKSLQKDEDDDDEEEEDEDEEEEDEEEEDEDDEDDDSNNCFHLQETAVQCVWYHSTKAKLN